MRSRPQGVSGRGFSTRELLAGLGVVLSLAFVGLEVRQNTIALQGQTRDSLARAGEEWLMTIAADGSFGDAMRRMSRDESLSASDSTRVTYALIALTRHHENVFLQVAAGAVDDSGLLSYGWRTPLYETSFYSTSEWPQIGRAHV